MERSMLRLVFGLVLITTAAAQPARPDLGAGSLQLDRGDFASAAQTARSFLRRQPNSVAAHVLLARAEMGLNDGAGALRQLREALRLDPDSVDALYYVSKLAGVLSQQEFAKLAQLAPESARMHQLRAELLEAQGNPDGAEREYLAALEKRPDTPYIMNALGDLKRHDKQYGAALEWYEKVLAKDPDSYDALYGAGVCRRATQSIGEAAPLFRRALQVDPSSTAARMALGEALLDTGNPKEAVGLLEQAAQVDPRLRRLQYLLARAYKAVGRLEDAQRALERVRELSDNGDSEEGEDR